MNKPVKTGNKNSIILMENRLKPGWKEQLHFWALPEEWRSVFYDVFADYKRSGDVHPSVKCGALSKQVCGFMYQYISILDIGKDDGHWVTSLSEMSVRDYNSFLFVIRYWLEVHVDERLKKNNSKGRAAYGAVSEEEALLLRNKIQSLTLDPFIESHTSSEVQLIDEKGMPINDITYTVIPLKITEALAGKRIQNVKDLHLYRCDRYKLITEPFSTSQDGDHSSITLSFSLQTKAGSKGCYLNLKLHTTRWIAMFKGEGTNIYLDNSINAIACAGSSSFVPVKIIKDCSGIHWDFWDASFYNMLGEARLPDVMDVLRQPSSFQPADAHPRILLPYKTGMSSFLAPFGGKGTGIPMIDRDTIHHWVYEQIGDWVEPIEEAVGFRMPVSPKKSLNPGKRFFPKDVGEIAPVEQDAEKENVEEMASATEKNCKPQNVYENPEQFRRWLRRAMEGTDEKDIPKLKLRLELYGNPDIDDEMFFMNLLEKRLLFELGNNTENSVLDISIVRRTSSGLVSAVDLDKKSEVTGKKQRKAEVMRRRCDELCRQIKEMDEREDVDDGGVVAAICLIPPADKYKANGIGDPKDILRIAFGCRNRVVQFINPDHVQKLIDDELKHAINKAKKKDLKVDDQLMQDYSLEAKKKAAEKCMQKVLHTVHDLYRHLGVYFEPIFDEGKMYAHKNSVFYGMYVHPLHTGILKNAKGSQITGMPMIVRLSLPEGKVMVRCGAFETKDWIPYYKACFQMAGLYKISDLDQRCTEAIRTTMSGLLDQLSIKGTLADTPQESIIIVENFNNNRKWLWPEVGNSKYKELEMKEIYHPSCVRVSSGNTYTKDSDRSPGRAFDLEGTGIRIITLRTSDTEVPDYYTHVKYNEKKNSAQYETKSSLFYSDGSFYSIGERPNDQDYIHSYYMDSRIDRVDARFLSRQCVEIFPYYLQSEDSPEVFSHLISILRTFSIQYDNKSTTLPLPLHFAERLSEYLFPRF